MANPNPIQTKEFKAQQAPLHGDRALSKRVVGVRFSVEIDEVLRAMPNAQSFIREAVEVALKAGI